LSFTVLKDDIFS